MSDNDGSVAGAIAAFVFVGWMIWLGTVVLVGAVIGTVAMIAALIACLVAVVCYLGKGVRMIHDAPSGAIMMLIIPFTAIFGIMLARVLIDSGHMLELATYWNHVWFPKDGGYRTNHDWWTIFLPILELVGILALIFIIFFGWLVAGYYTWTRAEEAEDATLHVFTVGTIYWATWGFIIGWAANFHGQ